MPAGSPVSEDITASRTVPWSFGVSSPVLCPEDAGCWDEPTVLGGVTGDCNTQYPPAKRTAAHTQITIQRLRIGICSSKRLFLDNYFEEGGFYTRQLLPAARLAMSSIKLLVMTRLFQECLLPS
jgi:hypothetical protein